MSILFLCCAKSLDFQIEELNKAGKKGKLAATQCQEILEAIRKGQLCGNFLLSKRTTNGEARVDKCIKYDLGNGYRLITIRNKDRLFIPFTGSHDKADLWLEHNRLDDICKKTRLYTVEEIFCHEQECDSKETTLLPKSSYDEYEEDVLSRVDDDMLRQVFRGLVT